MTHCTVSAKKTTIALREPSLGPCFGLKGGAAGGGYAQVVPMEDINLHFTGDFHAITTAHNLLAAVIDNHIQQGNALDLDVRRITWKRVLDLNDRALRNIICGLGGKAHGVPRETGFDITVASEMMAILCLTSDLEDMKKRLGNIIIGYTRSGRPVRAEELNVTVRSHYYSRTLSNRTSFRRSKALRRSFTAARSPISLTAATA